MKPTPLLAPADADPIGVEADPVEAGLTQLAGLLEDRDRTMGLVVRRLVALADADGLPERLGGMTLQVWLEHHGRMRGADARELLGAVDVLARMPGLVSGLCDRWLSWTQVRAICRAARTVPVGRLAELDALVSAAMVDQADWEPDALVADVWDWVDRVQPTRLEKEEAAAERGQFLTLAPRLFGGGSLYAEYGPVGFATVAEALAAPLGPPPAVPEDLDDTDAVDAAFDTLNDRRAALTRGHGQALAQRLLDLCDSSLAGEHGAKARPMLLAVTDLDALLDTDRTPGWLLTTLAGGRMKVSASLLQRLVDERGADLRGVVLDDCGEIVGVGRTTSVPPRWLREGIWARDLTVRDPDGSTPVRRADLDHRDPWDDDGTGGATDVDTLHPLGRRWHNFKTSKHWTVDRARDGTTTWTHRRHGWRLRLAPPRRDLADPPDVGPPRFPLDLTGLDPPPHRLAHTA